jgi:flagellar biosynthesis protein FlhF
MRLKSFYAKTVTEAMHMVRETLGEDAIIVATREERGGKAVRVTAAVDNYYTDQDDEFDMHNHAYARPQRGGQHNDHTSSTQAPDRWNQYQEEDDMDEHAVIEQLTDAMLRHAVPEDITDQVISCATVLALQDPEECLTAAFEHLFAFRPLSQKSSRTATMLVGPPGAGKTLLTAKLAARGVMNKQKVAVITTDTLRAGAVEQLAAFTKIMRVDLQKAGNARDLRDALDNTRGFDQVIIDTGGHNPFDPNEMKELARYLACGDISPVLVMPSALDADESGEIARIYSTLGVQSLLPTRLDIARRLGGLLSAAHHGSLIFADASNTPQVADGLIQLSPQRLTQLLLPSRRKPVSLKGSVNKQTERVAG